MAENYPQFTPPQPDYIGFPDAVRLCFNKYATFSGRATRAEFWWWELFGVIVGAITGWWGVFGTVGDLLSGLVSLALLLPSLAVCVRRMHDIGKGGGWIFINLIPLVGWIIFIVWCCKPSEPMPNRFGDVPAY